MIDWKVYTERIFQGSELKNKEEELKKQVE